MPLRACFAILTNHSSISHSQCKIWEQLGNCIQCGHQAAILKVTSLKISSLWLKAINNMHMKLKNEIWKQIWVTLQKPCHLQCPDTEKCNMAARRPFGKWHRWKYRLLLIATKNMHTKFEIEISKQPWVTLRKPCHLQTDGRTDWRTDGQTSWIQYTPPTNFVVPGYNYDM